MVVLQPSTKIAKQQITTRVPDEGLIRLNALAEQTGMNQSRLVVEALSLYLDVEVEGGGDRLTKVEQQVKQVQQKLKLLGN